jgi:hypothetical protein
MQAVRGQTLRVLGQLSRVSPVSLSIGLIAIRQNLANLGPDFGESIAVEGSSNLFFHLFNDWHNSYHTVRAFQTKMDKLVSMTDLLHLG